MWHPMLSNCTRWESTEINYLTPIFVEQRRKQAAAPLHSLKPLIWMAHIDVKCSLFQTQNWMNLSPVISSQVSSLLHHCIQVEKADRTPNWIVLLLIWEYFWFYSLFQCKNKIFEIKGLLLFTLWLQLQHNLMVSLSSLLGWCLM